MNDLHAQIADQVRSDFLELGLVDPGPDLETVRRRGRARRRRRQTVVAAGAAVALSAAGVLAVTSLPRPDDSSGSVAATPAQVSDPAEVSRILHASLDAAGIAHPMTEQPSAGTNEATGRPMGWAMGWDSTETDPKTAVYIHISPDGRPGPEESCTADFLRVRDCTEMTLPNGVQVMAAEYRHEIVDGTDRWIMWSPGAVAVYPDGREVRVDTGQMMQEGDQMPSGVVVEDYPGPLTVEQLRSFVQDPRLATIGLPAS